jgi:serine/threonine protein kinase
MIQPGTTVGNRYRVTRMIGGGGMKVVYQAEDLRLSDRLCALAEISDGFVDLSLRKQGSEAFQREASLLSQLENPHIPRVYDYFNDGSRYFLVMELVDGRTLESLLQESGGSFSEEYAVNISVQLASTLDYIHSRTPPIIYRDLKPSNVIVTPSGLVKLIDFGIARHFQPVSAVTRIGTPGYAAPEQYRGRPQAASDVYSLAALLHHMVSGRDPNPEPPFSFPPLQDLAPTCNTALAQLVSQGLEYGVPKRIASAREFRDRLVALKTGNTTLAPTVVLETSDSATLRGQEPSNVEKAGGKGRFCSRCGTGNEASSTTCSKCGHTLRQFYQPSADADQQKTIQVSEQGPSSSSAEGFSARSSYYAKPPKPQTNIVAALTYLFGFVTGLIFLYLKPYNEDENIRFHARQSIRFSMAWFAIGVVFGVFIAVLPDGFSAPLNFILTLSDIALTVLWVFLMYKAYNGEPHRIAALR